MTSRRSTTMEEILRTHRDAALKLLSENQERVREGIDLLVRDRLPDILAAIRVQGAPPLPNHQVETLYAEILSIAYNMFALGYSVSRLHQSMSEVAGSKG
ncbi:MAG: hypothetical protein DIU70_010980 [Bacillota bacterium]|nr:MAG: hypothetical protein DIU70_13910 [Bacillota bacterium]